MSNLVFLKAFSVPKEPSHENEDCWGKTPDGLNCIVCDGASISFDSCNWSKIIRDEFLKNQSIDEFWIENCIKVYSKNYDRDNLPWHMQASYDRGSFSSIISVRAQTLDKNIYIQSVGDSIALVLDGQKFISSFPYSKPEEFDQDPLLFSSEPAQNSCFNNKYFQENIKPIRISELADPIILLMTDALGKWVLNGSVEDNVKTLLSITSDDMFLDFVNKERHSGELIRDDTTLLVMRSE